MAACHNDTLVDGKSVQSTSTILAGAVSEREVLYLYSEKHRLQTLEGLSLDSSNTITKGEIAKYGFYYSGFGTKIVCIFCGVEIESLNNCTDIQAYHKFKRPECKFILNLPVGNIPLEVKIEINEDMTPYNKHFSVEVDRLKTYSKWPVQFNQKPEELARAGLYFTGVSDKTVCFQCGGGLKNWEKDDNPWQQHAKWFPGCQYVRLCLGDDVVAQAKNLDRINLEDIKVFKESDSELCIVCNINKRNVCYVPCGHILTCSDCSKTYTNCPSCDKHIIDFVKTFWA